jgi:hypothetical protein
MADNVAITAGSGTAIAADDVGSVFYQRIKIDGGDNGLAAPILGDSANGLDVDVTRLPALAAGTNNIGDVDVLTLPALAAGTANIGVVTPHALPAALIRGVTSDITDTTATSVIAAAGAGVVNYITSIMVTNSHATVGTFVNITDGSGGTVIWSGYAAPAGGGWAVTLPCPIKTTANTALYAVCVTTGANVRVCAAGYAA